MRLSRADVLPGGRVPHRPIRRAAGCLRIDGVPEPLMFWMLASQFEL